MPIGAIVTLAIWVVAVSFAAGKAYAESLRSRKDADGIRQLLNAQIELTRERWLHMVVVLMTMNEGKDVKTVLDLLKRELEKR
jgi:hypothetical protein